MSDHRRSYLELTARQKRRRRSETIASTSAFKKQKTQRRDSAHSSTALENNAEDEHPLGEAGLSIPIVGALERSRPSEQDSSLNPHMALPDEEKIERVVTEWSTEDKTVSNSSITRLLKKFREYYPSIPKWYATLRRKSFGQIQYSSMRNGTYAHFPDWYQNMASYLEYTGFQSNEVEIIINIDGIPLFKDSRRYHAYPILVKPDWQPTKIFVAGLYVSETPDSNKMPAVKQFLCQFKEDLTLLQNRGISVGDVDVNVSICAIVCDAPARAELKGIVGHCSYNSCERCIQHGQYVNGHVVLQKTDAPLRNNQSFVTGKDASHHKQKAKESPLYSLGVDFVRDFPLDYMHLVCLGVMRRLMMRWKSSKQKEIKRHLSYNASILFNREIEKISSSLPSDFNRRLRGGLTSVKFWKASEFRTFLLYVGVLVLCKPSIVPNEIYHHFLHLSVAMRVLLMDHQLSNLPIVQNIMIDFVNSSSILYGTTFLSYNVHSLIHLTQDYMKFGNLDKVSAFVFESFLGVHIKGCLRAKFQPIKQISNYVSMLNSKKLPSLGSQQVEGIRLGPVKKQVQADMPCCHKSLHWKGKVLKAGQLGSRDNGIALKNGRVGIIKSIEKESMCVQLFENESELFESPCKSSMVGIKKLKVLSREQCIMYDDLKAKVFIIVRKNSCVSIELLH